jgi:hypothetical protein
MNRESMANTASRDASRCALAGRLPLGWREWRDIRAVLQPWRITPARRSPRCTVCSCDMLLHCLLPHMCQQPTAPCRVARARRHRRDRMVPAPPQLDRGALRGDSPNTGRSSLRRREGQRYAQGSQGSWALLCGTFAALAWRGSTRNGSGWRPPHLPPPQKQPLSGSVPFAHAVCIRHKCVRTCACFSGGRGHKSPKAGRRDANLWASTSRVVTDISTTACLPTLQGIWRWSPDSFPGQ